MTAPSFAGSVRRIVPLAWPVLVGQLAVLAFSTVDTVLVARHSAADLAALAIGAAMYITVFIGLMGVVLAIGPIVGQLYGAGRLAEAGRQMDQTIWLAWGLTVIGSLVLVAPDPLLALSQPSPEVEAKVRGYLLALAFSLPASLLFTVYRGFNTAVSRPKAVMILQLAGLATKIPLSIALVSGLPGIGLPALGVVGCGIATLIALWLQVAVAWALLRRDPFYARFDIGQRRIARPDWPSLKRLLGLGLPMGGAILIEVSGFTFMAIFIARFGDTPVAGHQLAANLVAMMFMTPLALSNATGTLVAQAVGAGRLHEARALGWNGWRFGLAVSLAMAVAVYAGRGLVLRLYTDNPAIVAAATPLIAWLVIFHAADALQAISAAVLRAWHVATLPVVIYAVAIWGVGLGGGWLLANAPAGGALEPLRGAVGYWAAVTAGLVCAAAGLTALLRWVVARRVPADTST